VAGALVTAVGITAAFSIGIRGMVLASERWRNGQTLFGTIWATLAVLALGAAGAAVVIGVAIVAEDSPLG
jgi:hypothetical protein